MKKSVSVLALFCILFSLCAVPAQAASTELTGSWHDSEPIHNGLSCALYLDQTVKSCTELSMDLSIWDYSGAPFGNWYLYAKDLNDNWDHIADFKLNKDMGDGHTETYTFRFKQPQSFKALALCMRDKGNYYNLTWGVLSFYLGAGQQSSSTAKPTPTPTVVRGGLLSGWWGDREPIRNGNYTPFNLNSKMTNCTDLSMVLTIVDYTGYPFGDWYLYAKDLNDNWNHIGEFRIEKDQADGNSRTYDFHFKQPQSFKALAICVRDKGSEFDLSWDIDFYS